MHIRMAQGNVETTVSSAKVQGQLRMFPLVPRLVYFPSSPNPTPPTYQPTTPLFHTTIPHEHYSGAMQVVTSPRTHPRLLRCIPLRSMVHAHVLPKIPPNTFSPLQGVYSPKGGGWEARSGLDSTAIPAGIAPIAYRHQT